MDAFALIQQFSHTLGQIDTWLDKAAIYATSRSFDVENLCQARLAPDQYVLLRQIGNACDAAKFAAANATGKKAPSHPDTETTLAEVRARIASVRAWLAELTADDFRGVEDRQARPRFLEGKWLPATEYLTRVSIPNFYFHATTAYAILRHNGVPLGKNDFLGALSARE